MSDLQKGTTFVDGGSGNPGAAVNAARLHQLVENATILAGFVGNKADSSANVADGDYLLILQLTSGELRKITTVSLVNKATAAATTAVQNNLPVFTGHAHPPTSYQNDAHAWLKTGTATFGQSGLRMWDDTATPPRWRRVYNVPQGIIVAYAGNIEAPNFVDGVGQNDFDGWAYADGNHGTRNTTLAGGPEATTGVKYIQFIGYTVETAS